MEEETRDTNWNTDVLSQSYIDGIERLTGNSKDALPTFKVPQQVLEERKKLWNSFFDKYEEELPDEIEFDLDELKPKENTAENDDALKQRVPMRKSPSLVQYWVNTGNLPYSTYLRYNTSSDSGSSLSEKVLSQSQNTPTRRKGLCENKENKIGVASNFSCSSVDTAAYILSNANITKKAKTMATVEGARYVQCIDNESADTENADIMHPTTDNILSDDKANMQNNNDDNYKQCFAITKVRNSVQDTVQNVCPMQSVKKVYTVPDCDFDELIENETDIDSSQYKSNISALKQFVVKTSKSVLHDKGSVSWTEYDAEVSEGNSELHDDLNDAEDLSTEESNSIFGSDKKLQHRKKLYSGRDSPVDLICIKSSSIDRFGKLQKNLHPALDPTVTTDRKQSLLRRRQLYAKKRQRWCQLVSKKLASMSNSSQESQDESQQGSESPKDGNTSALLQSKDQNSADSSDGVNEEETSSVTSNNNFVTETISTESQNDPKIDGNNVTDNSQPSLDQNLQPVVRLIRLSDESISKYISTPERSLDKMKNVIIPLTRLTQSEIENYKPSKYTITEGKDVTLLENTIRLGDKNTTNIQLQRRSLRSLHSKRCHSKTDDKKIQNIDLEDVDSDQSTVLLCECKYGSTHECYSTTESSSFMNNSSQDVMYSITEGNNVKHSKLRTSQESIDRESTKSDATFKQPRLASNRSKRNLRNQYKGGLKNAEILRRIKKLKPIVLLERLTQEQLRNARIRKNIRNVLTNKRRAKSQDISSKNSVEMNNDTVKSLRATAKAKEQHTGTYSHNSLQLDERQQSSSAEEDQSDVSGLKRKKSHTKHHSAVFISSDEETEFVKFLRNVRNDKRRRLQSEPERHSNTLNRPNIIDTSEDESDTILAKAKTTKKESTKSTFTRRRSGRLSNTLQKEKSESDTTLKKQSTEVQGGTLDDISNSDVSSSIYTSARKNRNIVSLSSTKTMKSSEIGIGDKSLNRTPRTPKKNDNTSPKTSPNESLRRFKSSEEIKEKNIQTPVTRLRFRTRIFESDSESMSISSNVSEIF